MKVKSITKEDIEEFRRMIVIVHDTIIQESGGLPGLRDVGCLEFACGDLLNFFQKHHDEPVRIGVYTYNKICTEQYFFDGNKRTGHMIAKIAMLKRGLHLKPRYKEAKRFVIKIADKQVSKREIRE